MNDKFIPQDNERINTEPLPRHRPRWLNSLRFCATAFLFLFGLLMLLAVAAIVAK